MQCVFLFGYALNINNRRCAKLLFDYYSAINFVSAFVQLQSECKFFTFVCLSVPSFVYLPTKNLCQMDGF